MLWGKNRVKWKASSHQESNPGHLACAASALPLSYDNWRTTSPPSQSSMCTAQVVKWQVILQCPRRPLRWRNPWILLYLRKVHSTHDLNAVGQYYHYPFWLHDCYLFCNFPPTVAWYLVNFLFCVCLPRVSHLLVHLLVNLYALSPWCQVLLGKNHPVAIRCSCGMAICSLQCEEHFWYNSLALQHINQQSSIRKIHTN